MIKIKVCIKVRNIKELKEKLKSEKKRQYFGKTYFS